MEIEKNISNMFDKGVNVVTTFLGGLIAAIVGVSLLLFLTNNTAQIFTLVIVLLISEILYFVTVKTVSKTKAIMTFDLFVLKLLYLILTTAFISPIIVLVYNLKNIGEWLKDTGIMGYLIATGIVVLFFGSNIIIGKMIVAYNEEIRVKTQKLKEKLERKK